MPTTARFEQLRDHREALFIAFDPLGSAAVDVPIELGVDPRRVLEADGPLDLLSERSHGPAVVAWESARRNGVGSARVELSGESGKRWLEVFDWTGLHGCFVAVIVPDDSTEAPRREPTSLAPRRGEYRLDAAGRVLWFSPEFAVMFGVDDAFVGQPALTLVHPDDHEAGIVSWIDVLEVPGTTVRSRERVKTRTGEWLWCELTHVNHLERPGDAHVATEIVDISREVEAQAALQRRETILDRLCRALPTGVLVLDPDGSIAAENDRWGALLGVPPETGLDALLDRVTDREVVLAAVAAATEQGLDHDLTVDLVGAGSVQHGDVHLRPMHEGGEFVGLLVTLDDTTAQRRDRTELAAMMRTDPLTNALNRRGLDEALNTRLAKEDLALSVLFMDLDDFKSVNDTMGHRHGDDLLCAVVALIERHLSDEESLIARLGGDEFLVVVDDRVDLDEVVAAIQAEVPALRREFATGDDFGISFGRADRRPGDDFDSLVARADRAMYAVKPHRRRVDD